MVLLTYNDLNVHFQFDLPPMNSWKTKKIISVRLINYEDID